MALYKSTGTKNSSGQDVQEPASANRQNNYNRAVLTDSGSIYKRPDHIIINTTGSYAFNYDFTGSAGTSVGAATFNVQYESGSLFPHLTSVGTFTPVRLDIQPVAWRRTDHTGGGGAKGLSKGGVTFVYRGGK